MIKITLLNKENTENGMTTFVVATRKFPDINAFAYRAVAVKGMPNTLNLISENNKGSWVEIEVPTNSLDFVISNIRKCFNSDTYEIFEKLDKKEWTYEIL